MKDQPCYKCGHDKEYHGGFGCVAGGTSEADKVCMCLRYSWRVLHYVVCNYIPNPIGSPGCICLKLDREAREKGEITVNERDEPLERIESSPTIGD